MPEPKDDEAAERTTVSPESDRIDTNERADDVATVVDPDGSEAVEAIPDEQGRSRGPREKGTR